MARHAVLPNLYIKESSGGTITKAASYARNAVFDAYTDPKGTARPFVTQRPGVNILELASDTTTDVRGRGNFFWSFDSKFYFVNDDSLYQQTYATEIDTGTLSAGTERVYFFEIGDYMVITDPENNEAWYIDSAAPTNIVAISLPAALTDLADGGVVLNGVLFLADATTGDIFQSDVEDPTTWGALNFRNAEIAQDGLPYIGEHHQYVVALGVRTLEFFFWNNAPTGSLLSPRTDIDYSIGAVSESSFWNEADLLFWVGYTESGGIGAYMLKNFNPVKISTPSIDTFLGSAVALNSVKLMGTGFQIGGRIYYVLTLYNLLPTGPSSSDEVNTTETIVYEVNSNHWYPWELMHTGIDNCPIMSWVKTADTRLGQGILSNGDIITLQDDNNPQDTTGENLVYEADVYEPDVYSSTNFAGVAIEMQLVTGSDDMGTNAKKFESELWLVAEPTDNSQTLTVEVSDNIDDNWQTGRTLDTSVIEDRLRRNGSYRRRNRRLTYAGDEQYRLEGLQTKERVGTG